ncbi:unnamed protein product [Penicillium salamii]|nr:unnamed protein product [Penicillium salamii]
MVGTAGRSKGCRTCRRRKVKCDEGRPLCDRCHKAGFECGGYVEFVQFIDETSRLKSKILRRAPSPSVTSRPLYRSQSPLEHVINFDFSFSSYFPLTVNPSWNENEIMTTHLLRGIFDWDGDSTSPHATWDSILLSQDNETELSTASIRALSTVYFGKMNKQPRLMREGAKKYADALKMLQIKLLCQEQAIGDDVLIAIILLATYELICLTHPKAWLSHYKGLAKLMMLRGPHRHQSGVGLALMPIIRSCIALGYLVERKRCFLEEPAWKTIPWAKRGLDSKTPTDTLHDVLCDIPGILEDLSGALSWTPNVPGNIEFTSWFIPQVLSTLESLYSWRWDWQSRFPNSTFITTPVEYGIDTISLPPSPFKSIIWFSDPNRATELIVYNALRLMLTRTLQIVGVQQEDIQLQGASDPLLPMEGNRNDIATEICRMVSYHLSCFRRSSGAFNLVFPLNVAYLHLDPNSTAIRSWLESVMAVIADSHGFEIGRSENTPRKAGDVHGGLQ